MSKSFEYSQNIFELGDGIGNNLKFKDLLYFQKWKENTINLVWIAVPQEILDYQPAQPTNQLDQKSR